MSVVGPGTLVPALARTVIAEVARGHPAPAGVARLATLVGLTR
ncbi:hypothetical protein [Micromonospora sp. NBC_01638]|nr:hypothetical protein OG811_25645 [Micromonospora sp. NBC_01638]